MSFEPYSLLAIVFFSIIGIGALGYGRKLGLWQPAAIGLGLMAFPYFVSGVWLLWLVGSGLCVLLWFFHGE